MEQRRPAVEAQQERVENERREAQDQAWQQQQERMEEEQQECRCEAPAAERELDNIVWSS